MKWKLGEFRDLLSLTPYESASHTVMYACVDINIYDALLLLIVISRGGEG